MDALNKAISLAGSHAELTAGIGAKPNAARMWLARGNVPAEQRVAIERFLKGKVAVEEFGDDVRWTRVKDRSWPHPKGRPLLDVAKETAT
jgi:DNA-binding transcriptional regulator YdaS (Cro superfamily)